MDGIGIIYCERLIHGILAVAKKHHLQEPYYGLVERTIAPAVKREAEEGWGARPTMRYY
jgi:hypothetical protein